MRRPVRGEEADDHPVHERDRIPLSRLGRLPKTKAPALTFTRASAKVAMWSRTDRVPVEPESATAQRPFQRPLGTRSRRRRPTQERPYTTFGVSGALPATPDLRRHGTGCCRGEGHRRVPRRRRGITTRPLAPGASRLHRGQSLPLAQVCDTRPAVGTAHPSGGDHRGGELRQRFSVRQASKTVLERQMPQWSLSGSGRVLGAPREVRS